MSFQIVYNGITLGDNTAYQIKALQGVDGVELRVSEDNKVGRDGGNIWALLEGMRIVAFEGRIRGDNELDFFNKKRALVAAFAINTNNILDITTWDGTTRRYLAKVITMPMIRYSAEEGNITFVDFRVELKCEENFIRDDSTVSASTGLATGGGFDIPTEVPISWASTTSDEVVITNSGDYEDYPEIIITGPVLYPVIQNLTTGKTFRFPNTELFGAETIRLYFDVNGFWVYKNGTTEYYSDFRGEFFKLAVGANTIKFGASREDSLALLTINFINKYRAQ